MSVTLITANEAIFLTDSSVTPNTDRSIVIGYLAGAAMTGDDNVAVGRGSLNFATTATGNVCIGNGSGQNILDGAANTLIGNGAGAQVQNPIPFGSGFGNTCVGSGAGGTITSGFSNVFIGFNTGTNLQNITGSNNVCIGQGANPSANNISDEFTLGSQVNILRCQQTSITSLSDARDKKEIEELPVGLDFVKGLKPVKFTWDERDENGRHDVKDFGFIAQDLKKSQEDTDLADTLKLVYESNPEKLEASYGKLVPILVKAIQDLAKEVETLKSK
jgi:hypothetical protein